MFKDNVFRWAAVFILAAFLAVGCTTDAKSKELSKEEAEKALAEVFKEVKIVSMEPSPVEGLYLVVLESKGEKGVVYIDSSGNYVLLGSMIDVAKKSNLTKEKVSDLRKVDASSIPLEDALVMGDKGAKYKVIVFDDPD